MDGDVHVSWQHTRIGIYEYDGKVFYRTGVFEYLYFYSHERFGRNIFGDNKYSDDHAFHNFALTDYIATLLPLRSTEY